jgi:hypothetical protein
MIENYMGFPQGINGADLAARPATGGEVRRRDLDDAGGCEINVPR